VNIKFECIKYEDVDWDIVDSFEDRTIFQTQKWLEFIQISHCADPVIVSIKDNNSIIGYFTGMVFKKFGLKILGSPFKGWTTAYMGFNIINGISRYEILQSFPNFVFKTLRCRYLELVDRYITEDDYRGLPYKVVKYKIQELDLTRTEEEIFAATKGVFRRNVKKSMKLGLVVEESSPQNFAEEYYTQLLDVFRKQNLTPTYTVDRVRTLLDLIYPTGHLLLLRARDSEKRSIATGIFIGYNQKMYFWGGASLKEYLHNRPNEAIMWYAIQYWKRKGIKWLDLGGYAHYKEKFGPDEINIPILMIAQHNSLVLLRVIVYKLWSRYWKLKSTVKTNY
jgi:hypothetical protein